MDSVHFLNLEYFLLLVYRIFVGHEVDVSQVPEQTLRLMSYIAWVGLALFIGLLIMAIYVRRRLHEVEHAGWHIRHEEEKALVEQHIHTPKNAQWEHIMRLIASSEESDWRRAIIEADIMLDQMLITRNYSGATLGDKLKSANPIQFTTLDLAWTAHKVRNDIAHSTNYHLTEREARATIDLYRRVFEEFDYI